MTMAGSEQERQIAEYEDLRAALVKLLSLHPATRPAKVTAARPEPA